MSRSHQQYASYKRRLEANNPETPNPHAGLIQCPACERWCSRRRNGLRNHQKACPAHQDGRRREQLTEPSQHLSHDSRAGAKLPIPTVGVDYTAPGPPPYKRQRRLRYLPDGGQISLSGAQPTEMTSAPSESDRSSNRAEDKSHEPPRQLLDSEVYIVPHPYSGRHPTTYNEDTATPPPDVIPRTYANRAPPWHAFGSRDDFEQAEVFIRFGTSNPQINAQLALNQRRNPKSQTKLKNADDLHRILHELAQEEGPGAQYVKSEIEVEYPKSDHQEKLVQETIDDV